MIRSIPLLDTTKKGFMSLYRIWGLVQSVCIKDYLRKAAKHLWFIWKSTPLLTQNTKIFSKIDIKKKLIYQEGWTRQQKTVCFRTATLVSCSSIRHLSTMEWTEAYAIRFHNFRLDILSSNLSRDINDLSITTHQRLSHFMSCGKIGSRLMYHAEIKRQLAW